MKALPVIFNDVGVDLHFCSSRLMVPSEQQTQEVTYRESL